MIFGEKNLRQNDIYFKFERYIYNLYVRWCKLVPISSDKEK